MALSLNIDDLIRQHKVEGARIEYKRDWNPEKVLERSEHCEAMSLEECAWVATETVGGHSAEIMV